MNNKVTLIEARTACNWTGKQLAAAAGIAPAQISWIETGKHKPTKKTKLKIEKVVGRIVNWNAPYHSEEYKEEFNLLLNN